MSTSNTNHFSLSATTSYEKWRHAKLSNPFQATPVPIENSLAINPNEKSQILEMCAQFNFCLFKYGSAPKRPEVALQHLSEILNLTEINENLCADETGFTEIKVKQTATDNIYIPYTNRPFGWHTDGYYNASDEQIYSWLLYCHQAAAEGGSNALLDHDIAYIRIRDENPDWIRALMAADAFTIPPNIEGDIEIRGANTGPVFSLAEDGQSLHMRYSARQRNIIWKDDPLTQEASRYLLALLASDDEHIINHTLSKGEGVVSNNILHNRSRFNDAVEPDLKRSIYRARYHQHIT